MKKINVLILTHSLHIGGAEKHIYDLVSNMDYRKFRCVVFCLYELGEIGKRLSLENSNIKIYSGIMKNKADLTGLLKLLRISRQEKIDVIYIMHTPLTLFWGIVCAKLIGIRASVTRFTSTFPISRVKRRRLVNSLFLPFVDRVIAQASYHRKYLMEHEKVKEEKIVVINNGVNYEQYSCIKDVSILRKEIGIPQEAPVVGIIAQLRPEKGHEVFLNAAKIILESMPHVHFLIVGDGAEKNKLEKTAERLHIKPQVHFTGLRTDIPQVISLFNIAVLASRSSVETFSNAILEYMAASKPVVVTNVGSIAEQVVDGETGYIIPPGDYQAIADALLNLLNNESLSKSMGQAGRKRVMEKFSIQRMICEYEALFENCVEKHLK